MVKKKSYLMVSILDDQTESGICITTSQTKAQAIANRILSSSSNLKTIATLELSMLKYEQLFNLFHDKDASHLLDNGWIIFPNKHYSITFKMLELA